MAKTRSKHAAPHRRSTSAVAGLTEELPAGLSGTPGKGYADDLLAAMADRAIDQLLHERRSEPPEPDAPLTPAEQAALVDDDDEPLHVADLVTSMPTDEELEALLKADACDEPVTSPSGDAEAVSALADELDADALATAPGSDSDLEVDAIQADGALEARGSVNSTEPLAADAEEIPVEPALEVRTSRVGPVWWIKALIWLNAPFTNAPKRVRDGIGKVALVTLLNACAVLIYCLIIRR